MPRKLPPVEKILSLLSETPAIITELTDGLTPTQLHTPPNSDEWSANDVLAHLRACADVWGNCIATVLSQDTPTFRAVNPRTYMRDTDYPEQAFRPSFQGFIKQREALLAVLEPLAPEDWLRTAKVTGAGKPLERSVHLYAEFIAVHERSHRKQFKRISTTLLEQ